MAEVFNNHHNEDNVDQVTLQNSINCQENFPDLKKGIKLPKLPSQCAIANEFFKITFSNHPIILQDLSTVLTPWQQLCATILARILALLIVIQAISNFKVNIKHFLLKV